MGTGETGDKGSSATTEGAPLDPLAQAAIDKAAAEAAKARADAERAAAEARSAAAKAANDERDAAWNSSAAGIAKRDADARKVLAEADQAAATAKRNEYASLIPDFSKFERGSLELKGDQPLFGGPLAHRALSEAAANVAKTAGKALPQTGEWRVLVTSDADLVASHATYVNAITGIDQLCKSIDSLLQEPADRAFEVATVLPALAAAAGALPGLVSLFSAKRSVMTAPVAGDDFAAAAATAGGLVLLKKHGAVFHDDVRLLKPGRLHAKLGSLREKRQILAAKRLEGTIGTEAVKLSLAESLQTSVDAFITALTTIPEGAKRSPLEIAAWREGLRDVRFSEDDSDPAPSASKPDPRFTHVLLVKGNTGSVQQTVDDKPLWFKDRYSVVATASITYMLIQTDDGQMLAAGIESGSATGTGRIGSDFELRVRPGGMP